MAKQKKRPSASDLAPLRKQVAAWRTVRNGPGPMPAELWEAAVELARCYGPCQIARGVGVDYIAWRLRLAKDTLVWLYRGILAGQGKFLGKVNSTCVFYLIDSLSRACPTGSLPAGGGP